MMSVLIALSLIPFYLLGAFPTGYLIARMNGVDVTAVGSGNVGATNVSRVVGKKAGIVTLLVDVFKGAFGVAVASGLSTSTLFVALCAVAVVAGHCFSVPPYLKGGKGVATALRSSGSRGFLRNVRGEEDRFTFVNLSGACCSGVRYGG